MKGNRQGDFSRLLFDRRKHYSGVYLQQGRVQLDADWNAQVALTRYRQSTETVDVIGGSGAPAGAKGFGLQLEPGIELGAHGHFIAVGGSEGCTWSEAPVFEAGFTAEAHLLVRGEGVIFGRWVRREGVFELADQLRLEDGHLCFSRSGQPDLRSEPLDLVGRRCRLTVSTRIDVTTLYVDGEPVLEEASGFPGQPLEGNHFLIGATIDDNQPARHLDGLFYGFYLWGKRRTHLEIREVQGHAEIVAAADQLLGAWPFDEGHGLRLRDHSASCNHALVKGEGAPRWAYRASVSAGRYYVDGILCENEETVPFEEQKDYPGAELPRQPGAYLFYLDVWERSISVIEDPDLREVALGGLDTTIRSQTLAQVKWLQVSDLGEADSGETYDPQNVPEWQSLLARELGQGQLRARCRPVVGVSLGNDLYRVEIHHRGGCLGAQRPVAGDAATAVRARDDGWLELEAWPRRLTVGQPVEIYGSADDSPGKVGVVVELDAEHKRLFAAAWPDDGKALELPEEAHLRLLASLKWSRNNAASTFPITKLEAGTRLVELAPEARHISDLCVGGWVEVVDDISVLRREVGHLCRVDSVDGSRREIDLAQPPPDRVGSQSEHHPMLRAWDHGSRDDAVLPSGLILAKVNPIEIEEGIYVELEGDGSYSSGDYWWLPARQLAQDIEWPVDDAGEPLPLPPHGVDHRFAPVALLVHDEDGLHLRDLRRTFQPMAIGKVSKAGDEMDGQLTIRAGLEVWDDLEVRGQARLDRIYGRLCGQDMVDTPQLVPGSVTPGKLAPEVGVVPGGWSILGPTEVAPPGYVNSGSRMTLFPEEPQWIDRLEIPSAVGGPFHSAELDGRIYTLLESGDLWEVDPEAGTWNRRSDLPVRRRRFAMAALDGKLHVVGGVDGSERCTGSHLEYNPATDEWRDGEPMPTARCDLALAVYDGRLHALGGLRELPLVGSLLGRFVTACHEAWEPRTDTWYGCRKLPQASSGLAAAAVGNAIHAVGGERRWLLRLWGRIRSNRHQLYHPGSDTWMAERSPLPTPRRDLVLVTVGGRPFAIGGRGASGWMDDCDRYDPAVDLWVSQPPLHEPIDSPGAAALGGSLLVTGARRAPDAPGVLVEECDVATVYHVHQRLPRTAIDESLVEDAALSAFGERSQAIPGDEPWVEGE